MFDRVLVPTDGTTSSNHAVQAAASFVRLGATLTLFYAVPQYRSHYYAEGVSFAWPSEKEYLTVSLENAKTLLARAKASIKRKGVKVATAQAFSDSPAAAIVAAAEKTKADVIVMASHGRRGLTKLLLGSETQKVLALTKLPVLVVR
jgi:nucleotide-binding universal stress UspA family protein